MGIKIQADLAAVIQASKPEVMVDFTTPATVMGNIRTALASGVHVVVGTTGIAEEIKEIEGFYAGSIIPMLW